MEIKILNSILFGSLKPWQVDTASKKLFTDSIKNAGSKVPTTEAELVQQLKTLLQSKPDLLNWLEQQTGGKETVLLEPYYFTDLPAFNDTLCKFYSQVISLEVKRVFNAFKSYSETLEHHIDIIYNTNKLLTSIKTLIKQTIEEIEERGFEETNTTNKGLVDFTLQYLKHSLTVLFFSIQVINEEHLETIISPEDFHLLELEQPLNTLQEIHCMLPEPTKQTHNVESIAQQSMAEKSKHKSDTSKLSFGWKGNNVNTLQNLFDDLCVDINFLNEEKTSVETLVEILTAKEIIPGKINIHLGCKTTMFVFVMDNISKQFQRLTQTNIERSMSFWTKEDIKKPTTLITSTNFSKSRGKSKMRIELQEDILATIQKYFP